jgi:hypothetical protein
MYMGINTYMCIHEYVYIYKHICTYIHYIYTYFYVRTGELSGAIKELEGCIQYGLRNVEREILICLQG